jgi:urease accessory protein
MLKSAKHSASPEVHREQAIGLVLDRLEPGGTKATDSVTLTFDERSKSRLRTRLDSGEEAGIVLPRGGILRDGEVLGSTTGRCVSVKAAAEAVSTAYAEDYHALARACYHLGNRHLSLQIGERWVRYRRDHVIDDLARHLHLEVVHVDEPFEPEDGAYRQGGSERGQGHGHSHEPGHGHHDH